LTLKAQAAVQKASSDALGDQYKTLQIQKLQKDLDTDPIRYISMGEGLQNLNDALDKIQRVTPAKSTKTDADVGRLTYSQIGGIKRWINQKAGEATTLSPNINPGQALINMAQNESKNGSVKLPQGPDAKSGY